MTPRSRDNQTAARPLATWLSFALAILVLAAARANATTVLAILSAEAQPYRDAESAMEQTLSAKGDSVSSILLSDAKASPLPKADFIVAIGSEAAIWAHDHAPNEPVYYCMVPNAAEAALDKGRVCRGVTTDVPLSVQFSLVAEVLPNARTIGMLYRSDTADGRENLARVQAAIPQGWTLQAVAVNEFESKSRAIEELLGRKVDVVWTSPDPGVYDVATLRTLLLGALRHAVPVYGFSQAMVRSGRLMGIAIDSASQGRDVANLILDDLSSPTAKNVAATTPLARPPEYEFVINQIVASKLDLSVPDTVLQRTAIVFKSE